MNPTSYDSFERLASRFIVCQFLILAALVGLSVLNELADLPHLWFGASPTTAETRWAEVGIEAGAFGLVAVVEVLFIRKLRRELRVLHGLMPICEDCRKVHHDGQWLPLEEFITNHSMAFFHHTTCPQCNQARQSTEAESRPALASSSSERETLSSASTPVLRLAKSNPATPNPATLSHP